MKKAHLFFLCFHVAILTIACGQTDDNKDVNQNILNEIPEETVFIHYNSGTLFSGETLNYKLYCMNLKKNNLSTLSKIAYVELVGADNAVVFKHKIKLNSGEGQGDFFITVEVPSGNYKLIGYTQWMQNEGPTSFFQGDIMIINPYEKSRKPVAAIERDSLNNHGTTAAAKRETRILPKQNVMLTVKKTPYQNKTEVSIKISSLDGTKAYGNYSISVRKVDDFNSQPLKTAQNYRSTLNKNRTKNKERLFLPELRGELVSGEVVSNETGQPLANAEIALSIPGKAYILDLVSTDDKGKFFFNLNRDYDGENAILQLLDEKRKGKITTREHSAGNYSHFEFAPFRIDSKMRALIEQRSIHSQIENAYSEIRRDSIFPMEANYPFFYDKSFDIFDLDDYTRFPTIRETFIEVVQRASIRNQDEKSEFSVLPSDSQLNSFYPPLIVVDGILLQDHSAIIEYGAKNIKRILVFREKYFYGSIGYQGALVFETVNGDFFQRMDKKDAFTIKLFKPQPRKDYFNQAYHAENAIESNHVPDYRYQLLWDPDFKLDIPEKSMVFFTSDISGEFEIRFEGFTTGGEPVSRREIITVE